MGMMNVKSFEQTVDEMKDVADTLLPYTYPKTTKRNDLIVSTLKQRVVFVDGYKVAVQFSRGDYDDHYVEGLEITSANCPFLPMYVVCKIAAKFLGGYGLRHSVTYQHGRKVYRWHVMVDKQGHPLPIEWKDVQPLNFEDFEFVYAHRN